MEVAEIVQKYIRPNSIFNLYERNYSKLIFF